MADLVHTVSFRCGESTYAMLKGLAEVQNRKLGDVVRILVEQVLAYDRRQAELKAEAEQEAAS